MRGGRDRHDLIVVAVDDQRRPVDPLQVLGVVDLGEFADAVVLPLDAALQADPPEVFAQALVARHAVAIEAVERHGQVVEELRAVLGGAVADAVEHRQRRAVRIGVGLQHQRRHRADQHDLRDAGRAVAAEIVRHLAAPGRMADQDQIAQVERLDQLGQIVGVLVHVVAVPGLVGAAMAAAVMGDHAKALLAEEQHLLIPGIGRQRPAMGEQDRLARAPILVEQPGPVAWW